MLVEDVNKFAGLNLVSGYNECPFCGERKFRIDAKVYKCFKPSCVANKQGKLYDILTLLNVGSKRDILSIVSPSDPVKYTKQRLVMERAFDAYVYCASKEENSYIIGSLNDRAYGTSLETTPIGYAPNGTYLQQQGLDLQVLKECGLVKPNGEEFYQDRVIFPIYNSSGHIVHFRGRAVTSDPHLRWLATPKREGVDSINSYIFGVNSIKANDIVFFAEGVSDALSLIELGVPVIACFGLEPKLLSYKQLGSINTLVACFDSDRFSSGKYAGKYKSWSRILIHLMTLQKAYPHISIKCLPPNRSGVKDVNEWLLAGLTLEELLSEAVNASTLVNFAGDEFKDTLDEQCMFIKNMGHFREAKLKIANMIKGRDPIAYFYDLLNH